MFTRKRSCCPWLKNIRRIIPVRSTCLGTEAHGNLLRFPSVPDVAIRYLPCNTWSSLRRLRIIICVILYVRLIKLLISLLSIGFHPEGTSCERFNASLTASFYHKGSFKLYMLLEIHSLKWRKRRKRKM